MTAERGEQPDRSERAGRPQGPASLALALSPRGRFYLEAHEQHEPGAGRGAGEDEPSAITAELADRLGRAFGQSSAHGLLELGSSDAAGELPQSLAFGRELARCFLTRLSQVPDLEERREAVVVPVP